MMRTLWILLRKEFILFSKNKVMPKIAFIFPCVAILLIPLAATMDVRHVGVAVVNLDNSRLGQNIITGLRAVSFFSVEMKRTYAEALESVKHGEADVILEIPRGFQKKADSGAPLPPHISANGVDGIKGSLGAQYVARSVAGSMAAYANMEMEETVSVDYLYNPALEYRNNMIPALMIMLLIMICGFMPALNLVGEKESGTIEQMNVSPVGTTVFVLSKVIPYWIIGIIDISLAMCIAFLAYGLAPAGPPGAIYAASLLFIFVMSGIGIIIANSSSRMSQSMLLMFFIIVIFVLMSGLLTPISSMPDWARHITYALPPRYFIEIMRSVYLKATPVPELGLQYVLLAGFAVLANSVAALTCRKRQ